MEEEHDNRAHVVGAEVAAAALDAPAPEAVQEPSLAERALELLHLSQRVRFYCVWAERVLAVRPGLEVRPLPPASTEALLRHLARLETQYHDLSLSHEAQQLLYRVQLSPGALDELTRQRAVEREHVRGAEPVNADRYRRLSDAAAAYRYSLLTLREAAVDAAEPDWMLSEEHARDCGDPEERRELRAQARELWHLALLNNELRSQLDCDWLDEYVVDHQDVYARRLRWLSAHHEGRPRLPLLLNPGGQWVVYGVGVAWRAADVYQALVGWAQHVLREHDGRTERGLDLRRVLHQWVA